MKLDTITPTQKRALAITTGLLLILAFLFLRRYVITIVTACILAYLFAPIYNRFRTRVSKGLAATGTFLSALAIIIIPIALLLSVAAIQVSGLVGNAITYFQNTSFQEVGNKTLDAVNDAADKIPFTSIQITEQDIKDRLADGAQAIGNWLPGFLQSSASNFLETITLIVIFIYLFFSLLTKQDKIISIFKQLNPLGDQISDMYLAKTGSMVKATVRGQFIIALMQGVSGAASIYIAGFHQAVVVLVIILTIFSLIPLGSGIIAIPFGLGLMAFGNITGGLLVIIWHMLITNTIDNVMRPVLVPKDAQLDASLVMLSVFAGIATFGLIGIVIGPVFMILLTTTIDIYRHVHFGVPLEEATKSSSHRFRKQFRKLGSKLKA